MYGYSIEQVCGPSVNKREHLANQSRNLGGETVGIVGCLWSTKRGGHLRPAHTTATYSTVQEADNAAKELLEKYWPAD